MDEISSQPGLKTILQKNGQAAIKRLCDKLYFLFYFSHLLFFLRRVTPMIIYFETLVDKMITPMTTRIVIRKKLHAECIYGAFFSFVAS